MSASNLALSRTRQNVSRPHMEAPAITSEGPTSSRKSGAILFGRGVPSVMFGHFGREQPEANVVGVPGSGGIPELRLQRCADFLQIRRPSVGREGAREALAESLQPSDDVSRQRRGSREEGDGIDAKTGTLEAGCVVAGR